MKANIPSTIEHAFLPKRKSIFYLPRIGKVSNLNLSMHEILESLNRTNDFDEIQILFSQLINHFSIYQDLLSEIKNEYSLVMIGLQNIKKESEFLKYKIQKIICQNGTKEMVNNTSKYGIKLKEIRNVMSQEIESSGKILKNFEKEIVINLGNLYKKSINDLTDDKQRMLLAYKGRIGFIKDWLLHHGSIWPEFLDLCHHVEENSSYYKSLLTTNEDFLIEKYDSPEVKRIKTEIAEQIKKSENYKREIEKAKENISRFRELIFSQDQKIDGLNISLKREI